MASVSSASLSLWRNWRATLVQGISRIEERGILRVAQSYGEDIIFSLTKDEVLACANELGRSKEQVTDDVIEPLKRRVSLEFSNWPAVVKSALKETFKCR